ncbi:hypothetical protein CAPTEDRAFT_220149 [Capitella teleta]|uniref:Ras-associating domain-containing protein n=1 Tax=Capitella teleta TaxID=283909 RepID=R7URZ1_CAPTE|nr:hypothetical protein CAPTEDRAFT_220149 [Capitella teleta]|eukprot:ELU06677.1 hypothetical protein CAPTEDRAFT_220149 [Capitella teleta]
MDMVDVHPAGFQSHLDRWLCEQQWNTQDTAVSLTYTRQRHQRVHHFASVPDLKGPPSYVQPTVQASMDPRQRSVLKTSSAEIPIHVSGVKKWITGLNRRTTCDDVVFAIMQSKGKENVKLADYTIWERWRDVERPLRGRTKILKVWRAWGAEGDNVQFYLRKLENPLDAWRRSKSNKKQKKQLALRAPRSGDQVPDVRIQTPGKRVPDFDDIEEVVPDRVCESPKPPLPPRKRTKEAEVEKEQKSWAYEHLVQIILDQEKLIREQSARIFRIDEHIDQHESRLHELRIEADGEDYVQNAYMETGEEGSGESQEAAKEQQKEAQRYLEKLDQLQERIRQEEAKIDRLSREVIEESFVLEPPDVSFSHCVDNESINVDFEGEGEVDELRGKIDECLNVSQSQHKHIQLMKETLQGYDAEMDNKKKQMEMLIQQLQEDRTDTVEQHLLPPLLSPIAEAAKPLKKVRAPVTSVDFELKISKPAKYNTGNSYSDCERLSPTSTPISPGGKFFDSLTSLDEGSLGSSASGDTGLGSLNSEEGFPPVMETLV